MDDTIENGGFVLGESWDWDDAPTGIGRDESVVKLQKGEEGEGRGGRWRERTIILDFIISFDLVDGRKSSSRSVESRGEAELGTESEDVLGSHFCKEARRRE